MTHIEELRGTQLFLVTGNESFDCTMNENFVQLARRKNIPLSFEMLDGAHMFKTVSDALPDVIHFMENTIAVGEKTKDASVQ